MLAMLTYLWYSQPMPVKDHYHHGALKEALLAEAMRDLETEGLEGVSLRRLAESAGVSKTAPYRHFSDKRDLLVAMAADGFRLLAEALESVAPPPAEGSTSGGASSTESGTGSDGATGGPLGGVRSLFRAYMDFARARPALYKLMISRLGYELHSEACRLNSEKALGSLIRAVQTAQAAGWRSGKESMALVLSLWASVHGWATLLIDGLLPTGIVGEGDDWLEFAQVL